MKKLKCATTGDRNAYGPELHVTISYHTAVFKTYDRGNIETLMVCFVPPFFCRLVRASVVTLTP